MSATGVFASAQATLAASLTALGLVVVTDTRNARPMTVLIHPPDFQCFNDNIADITFLISVMAAPPGNQDAADYLMTAADTVMNSPISLISGRPGMAQIGVQDDPTYELIVRLSTSRN